MLGSMPVTALALLFVAAILHTTWNLLLKQAGEKQVATWWGLLLGSAVFLPALAWTGLPARETWVLLLCSVLGEAAYYLILTRAYGDSDFSLVYPLSRGAAPALIVLWSSLFLGERPSLGGGLGLGVIILGLLIVGGSGALRRMGATPQLRGVALALLLALMISIYSTLSGAAVKRTPAFPYAVAMFFLTPVLLAPVMFRRFGWPLLKRELALHHRRLLAIGLLIVSAYTLSLAAYRIAPVGYTGAVREVSVVFAAFAGWRLLGEPSGGMRVVGSLVIFTGILLIALLG